MRLESKSGISLGTEQKYKIEWSRKQQWVE